MSHVCVCLCVCVCLSLSLETTGVFRHADPGLALGEREGKMKEEDYFEKPWFCDADIFLISD